MPPKRAATKRKAAEVEDVEVSGEEVDNEKDEDYEVRSPKKRANTGSSQKSKGSQTTSRKRKATTPASAKGGKKGGKKAAAAKNAKKKGGKRKKKNDEEDSDDDSSLFAAVKKRAATNVAVADWVNKYEEKPEEAVLDLINFLLKACGCDIVVSEASLDEDDLLKLLEKASSDKQYTERGGDYPINSRKPTMKRFKEHFLEFWDKLITKASRTIIHDDYLLPTVISWLLAISSHKLRPLRHTATLAGLQIVRSLIKVVIVLRKEQVITQRQLEIEEQKSKKKAADKVKDLKEKQEDLFAKVSTLDELINNIFGGIFMHRYRDIFPTIRAECISALGEWVCEYKLVFLADKYLKYIGWSLHDKIAEVRLSAIRALTKIYSEQSFIPNLELFSGHFKSRIIGCVLDKETNVAVEAIGLVTILAGYEGILTEEDVDTVYSLMSDSNCRIRHAVSEFVRAQLLETAAEGLKDKHQIAEAQLKALLSFVVQNCKQSSLPNYVVDALWGKTPLLKNWSIMTEFLQTDTLSDLQPREQNVLVRLLVVCIKKAAGQQICPKAKGDPETKITKSTIEKDLDSITDNFVDKLPELLETFKADYKKIEELVEIPQFIKLDAYHVQRRSAHFKELLKQLKSLFLQFTQDSILANLSVTLKKLFADHALLKHVEVTFGELVDELSAKFVEYYPNLETIHEEDVDEQDEYGLALSLRRIYQLYLRHDLTLRLNIYDQTKALIGAYLNGTYQQDEVAIPALGILSQELLWRFKNFDMDDGDPKEITQKRDELLNLFEKLLQGDVASAAVQKTVYNILCDLLIVFRPGMRGKLQPFSLRLEYSSIPQTLVSFFNRALHVESKALPVKEPKSKEEKEKEKEEAKKKEQAKAKGKGKGKEAEDDDEKGKGKGKDKGKEKDKGKGKAKVGAKTPAKGKEAGEKPKEDTDEEVEAKEYVLLGLSKLISYRVLSTTFAPSVLAQFLKHGTKCKTVVEHFLHHLKTQLVKETDPYPVWQILQDTLKAQFAIYLDTKDPDDAELELEYFRELATRLAMSYGLVAKSKDTKQLLMLVQTGITYVFEEAPERFPFLDGLHRFVSAIGSSVASVSWIHDETVKQAKEKLDRYPPPTDDSDNDPYHSWISYLQKLLKGKGSATAGEGDAEAGEEPPAKKRKTTQRKVNKKLVPLEIETVPSTRKKGATPSKQADEEEEEEDEEEGALISKKAKRKAATRNQSKKQREEEAEEEDEAEEEEEEDKDEAEEEEEGEGEEEEGEGEEED